MTALGGVALHRDVTAAMAEAAGANVEIEVLKDRAGERIAAWCGAEAAMVTPGAAAGIVIMAAAVVTGGDPHKASQLPDVDWPRREIVLQLGHAVNYGCSVTQTIRMAGGRPVLAGSANLVRRRELEGAITERTAGILFVQSHHAVQKGMLGLREVVEIAASRGVPVLVDAAAEEDPRRYVALGADLVTYSGGKAFEGPTSGFIVGRCDLIAACRVQESGIARPMKVGKETIVGLLAALERYLDRDGAAEQARQAALLAALREGLADLPHKRLDVVQDEAGRAIRRLHLTLDAERLGFSAAELADELTRCNPPIYPRAHLATTGTIALDPRALAERDVPVILAAIRATFRRHGAPVPEP
jgi:uncharacterized pyridoxal phosphate-dependent enzyme